MKDKNIFDILENADSDAMNRITDKCPEISDDQLEKILSMSESKYNMKKNSSDRTKKDNIETNSNDVVVKVEHIKRPAWVAPLCTAASLIIIVGLAAGVTIFKNRTTDPYDICIPPAVTVITDEGVTTSVSSDNNGITAASTDKSEVTTNETETTTSIVTSEAETGNSKESITTGVSAYGLVGKWTAKKSTYSNNYIGHLNIEENSFYTYTDADGNVTTGIIDIWVKEHSDAVYVKFLDGEEVQHSGYYDAFTDTIELNDNGNCFVRGEYPLGNFDTNDEVSGLDMNKLAGSWIYEIRDGINDAFRTNGTVYINADGTYAYHDKEYNITCGTVKIGTEEIWDTQLITVGFYIDNEHQFGGYYRETQPLTITLGNGGLSQLVKMD